MAEYVTAKDITIPAGTRLSQPEPIQKKALTYAWAKFPVNAEGEKGKQGDGHFQIELDGALKLGLVKEVE